MRLAIQIIAPIVSAAGEDEVEDRLVDPQVDAGDLRSGPRLELELVLGLELVVLAVAAEDQTQAMMIAR